MPGSLGGLVVSLGLNAVEFTTGLTKAEREAQKFALAIDKGIAAAANAAAIGIAAIGTAAAASFVAFEKLIDQAGQFQDLAEKTGGSAEGLASLGVAAKVAGTNMDELANFSIKLSKNLAKSDEESSNMAKALAAIGIPLKEFKALKPEEQFERLAKALAQFSDVGGGKAAVLENIAKGGAQLLPFLKELEESGGRQIILTDAQIKRADDFTDAQKRAAAQLNLYAQAFATEMSPAVTAFTLALKDAITEMLGLNTAAKGLPTDDVRRFAEGGARALAFIVDAGQGVVTTFLAVGTAIAGGVAQAEAIAALEFKRAKSILFETARDINALLNKPQFSQLLEQRLAAQRAAEAANAVGPPAPGKPILKIPDLGKTGAGAAAERTSEAERFLESLKRQLETTEQLTAEEKALNAIQSGRLKGLTPNLEASILSTAREIDQIKALEEARKAHEKAVAAEAAEIKKANDERERAINSAKSSLANVEAGNQSIREEIAILVGGEEARKRVEQSRIANAIAIKKEFLGTRELNGASKDEIELINKEIEALENRSKLVDSRDLAESLKRDAEALQSFKDQFSNTFADAFADFVSGTKTADKAFKDFAKSIEQQITRMAAQSIGNALFGGKSGGPDFFDILTKLASAAAGSGSDFGSAGGSGGFGTLASGTDFWRGGPTVVGEQGPEVVNLPRGATVTSNAESKKAFGPTMNFVVNVLPGASTKTAQQAAAMTGISVQRALARNT